MEQKTTKPTVIIFLGKVGCGKRTQADLLADKWNYKVISPGDGFRAARELDSYFGAQMRENYDSGAPAPSWFADYLVTDALINIPEGSGIIFESGSKKPNEAKLIHEIISWLGYEYRVIELDITDEASLERVMSRNRGDALATPEMNKVRLEEFERNTRQSINFYQEQGKLITIDGMGSIEAIQAEIIEKIG